MKKKLIFIFIFFAILKPSVGFSLVEIDITRGNLDPMPISVSPFFSDENTNAKIKNNINIENLGLEISKIIENNLEKTGLFDAIEKDAFLQKPDIAHLKPRFEDWALIKSQVLITGKVTSKIINDKDYINIEFKLWDVLGAKMVDGFSLTTTPRSWRRVGHKISDKVYERLTGENGYFDTRIIYVAEEGPKTQRVKKLALMDQDGFNTKYITLGNELVLTPRFNPANDKEITYMSYFRNMPRVYIVNLQTGEQKVVGDFRGMTFAPRFSPDGKKLIMSLAKDGNSEIWVRDLETNIQEKLTDHPSIDTSLPIYLMENSSHLILTEVAISKFMYESDGSKVKRISFGKGIYGTPVWSPRGDLIAFTKLHKGKFFIGVMRTDGSVKDCLQRTLSRSTFLVTKWKNHYIL